MEKMSRGFSVGLCACLSVAEFIRLGSAQNVGDHWTAGFVNERTYLNSNMDNFNPPLKLFETINLPVD